MFPALFFLLTSHFVIYNMFTKPVNINWRSSNMVQQFVCLLNGCVCVFCRQGALAGLRPGSVCWSNGGSTGSGPVRQKQVQPGGEWQTPYGQSRAWHQTWPVRIFTSRLQRILLSLPVLLPLTRNHARSSHKSRDWNEGQIRKMVVVRERTREK